MVVDSSHVSLQFEGRRQEIVFDREWLCGQKDIERLLKARKFVQFGRLYALVEKFFLEISILAKFCQVTSLAILLSPFLGAAFVKHYNSHDAAADGIAAYHYLADERK